MRTGFLALVGLVAVSTVLASLVGVAWATGPAPSREDGLAPSLLEGVRDGARDTIHRAYAAPAKHDGPGQGAKEGGRGSTYYVATNGIDAPGQDGSEADPWLTLSYALTRVSDGDWIWIKPGTYVETGQLLVDKDNLWIAGWGSDQTTLKKAENTGDPGSGDNRAWFRVVAGKHLELSDMTIDGSGRQICIGVLSYGWIWAHGLYMKDIGWTPESYYGRGICIYGGVDNIVSNCEFSDIRRIGVFTFGAGVNAVIDACVYAGKGSGTGHLDYAFEVGGGAEIAVYGCSVGACRGVANDGSTSAGILATTYFAAGTALSALWNTITDCTTGIAVGYDGADVTFADDVGNNNLAGNDIAIGSTSTTRLVNARLNWYGYEQPDDVAGQIEGAVDYSPWVASDTSVGSPPYFEPDSSVVWVEDIPAYYPAYVGGVIGEGIDLVSGSTVHVAPGTYAANVTVNKKITLQGSGDGSNPLVDTIISPPSGTGILLTAGGSSAVDRLVIRDLRTSGGGSGIYTYSVISYITLENITIAGASSQGLEINNPAVITDLKLIDCDFLNNVTGFRVRGRLDGLVVQGGHADGNTYGMTSYTGAGEGNNFRNVTITGMTFNNNTSKGMYLEKLSDAVFDGITVSNSGTAGTWAAGIDINLKYTAYQNITIQNNSIVTGCGGGDATNGVGITIKARDDGSYSGNPATLTGVDIVDCTISGCQNGIRFGEPTKNNAGPTDVTVTDCQITGSVADGLINATQATTGATCNWWGDIGGPDVPPASPNPSGETILGGATYAPWWTTASGPCDGYGDDHAFVDAGAVPCYTGAACVEVPVVFHRADASNLRLTHVIIQLSDELELCDPGNLSANFVTTPASGWLYYGFTNVQRQYLDNGGKSYTVDQTLIGVPCGVTATGDLILFKVKVKASGTALPEDTGTITVTAFTVRGCANEFLAGIPGPGDEVTIDRTAPGAIGDLAAVQDKTGNDADGTTKVDLTFGIPGALDYQTTEIYRKGYGFYPEYDDLGGGVPATPATPAAAVAAGWVLAGTCSDGSFTDETAARDFYYYVAFNLDDCGNVSAVSNKTGGTLNYHLGDVASGGNNWVDGLDISLLGTDYGKTSGFVPAVDVGPTTDYSVNARPTTDNLIDFEDLIMFAINFMTVNTTPPAPASGAPVLQLVWEVAGEGTPAATLVLQSNAGMVKGIHALVAYDQSQLKLVGVTPGTLATEENVFFKDLADPAGVVVDVAKLGQGAAFTGSGEVAILRFEVLEAGAGPSLAVADLRGVNNEFLGAPTAVEPIVPEPGPGKTAMLLARPNPFTGQTEILFRLSSETAVALRIFDASGRLVRTLVDGSLPAGEHVAGWDGTDDGGHRLDSGIYFYALQAGDAQSLKKMILLK